MGWGSLGGGSPLFTTWTAWHATLRQTERELWLDWNHLENFSPLHGNDVVRWSRERTNPSGLKAPSVGRAEALTVCRRAVL